MENNDQKKNYILDMSMNVSLVVWNSLVKDIIMAFDDKKRSTFLDNWNWRFLKFDFEAMFSFYEKHQYLSFDKDVIMFFSFLEGSGFFKSIEISFEDWLNSHYFINPNKETVYMKVSIKEASMFIEGEKYMKYYLSQMHWLR